MQTYVIVGPDCKVKAVTRQQNVDDARLWYSDRSNTERTSLLVLQSGAHVGMDLRGRIQGIPLETTTYHGDPAFKTAFLAQIAAYEEADAIVQGTYGKTDGVWRGCAVGCSLRSLHKIKGRPLTDPTNDHVQLAQDLSWPLWLVHLEDYIFERLPADRFRTWPRRFSEAVPVGVVIDDAAFARILRWMLVDRTYGVRYSTDDAKVIAVVDQMAALFDRVIVGDMPPAADFCSVARDAWCAKDAWDTWNTWDAWDYWCTRDVRTAKVVCSAGDVWDIKDGNRDHDYHRDRYHEALSDHVIATVRTYADVGDKIS